MEEKKTLEGATLNTENTNIEGEKKIVGGSVELNPDVVLDVETETPETEMPAEDAEDLIAEMYQQAALLTDKANDLIQTANALMGANSISTLDLNVDDGGTPTPSLKSAPMMLAANAGGGESLPTFQPTGKALNSVPTPTSVTPASANVFVNEGGNIKQVAVMNLAKSINNLIKATPSSAIPYVLGSDANGNQIASTIENLAQVVAERIKAKGLFNSMIEPVRLTSSDNLNDVSSGFYEFSNGDNPTGSIGNNATALCIENVIKGSKCQISCDGNTGNMYARVKLVNGTWTSWKKLNE